MQEFTVGDDPPLFAKLQASGCLQLFAVALIQLT